MHGEASPRHRRCYAHRGSGAGVANYILLREFFIVLGSDQDDLLCNDWYEESNMQLAMPLSGLP